MLKRNEGPDTKFWRWSWSHSMKCKPPGGAPSPPLAALTLPVWFSPAQAGCLWDAKGTWPGSQARPD